MGFLAKAIDDLKVFICCVTKDYCASNNCNLEFDHAFRSNKLLIPILIDDLEPLGYIEEEKKIHEITVSNGNYPCGIGFQIGLVNKNLNKNYFRV